MNKQFSGYILSALLMVGIVAFAQQKNCPIKKINGVEYYVYTVQPSEGLFAVGRKFEIPVDEIARVNPEAKSGLKSGQQILIPVKKHVNQPVAVKKNDTAFVEHMVKQKQTLFAICNKYSVTPEDLKKYNPSVASGLREGMVLRIPVPVRTADKKDTLKQPAKTTTVEASVQKNADKPVKDTKKTVLVHVVQADETLYSISRRYKVTVEELIALNPASASRLAVGAELKIPAGDTLTSLPKKDAPKKDTLPGVSKQEGFTLNKSFEATSLNRPAAKRTLRIAYLLPFMLNQEKKDASIERFVDFYAGSLLAIGEAKEKGISFEIHTYDTENSDTRLAEVLQNSELKTMDLIIGPAFTNQVPIISEFAQANHVNTLIPFTSKVPDIDSNPYLFQFNPGSDAELDFATELLTGKYKTMHVIFAELPGISSSDEGSIWAEKLKKQLKKANKSFVTLDLNSPENADFGSVMQYYEKNLVIFNTDKFAYVSPYAAALKTAATNYKVVLYEQYSWRSQSDKLPKGLCLSPFMPDMEEQKVDVFNHEFNAYFGKISGKDTPRYDLLGYDLTSYFSELLSKYGVRFTEKIGLFNFAGGVQSKPRFERRSNGSGFVNQQLYLIQD